MLLNAKAAYKSAVYFFDPQSVKDLGLLDQITKVDADDSLGDNLSNVNLSIAFNSEVADNWLSYPGLGIKAPIFWDVPIEESNEKMNFGLVHILGTALSGNGGEGLISGHSSQYWWQSGDYKEIFAILPKAKKGDRFIINKAGIRVYKVDKIYQVSGSEYMNFNTSGEERIKLMTCVPLGTNLKRLIVEAKLIAVL